MKGGTHSSPYVALSFPDSKKVPITTRLTETVFQSLGAISLIPATLTTRLLRFSDYASYKLGNDLLKGLMLPDLFCYQIFYSTYTEDNEV